MNLLKTDKGCKQSIMLCGHIKKHDKNEGQTSQVIKESLEDGDVKALNFTFVPKIRSLPAVHKVFVPNREVKPNQNVISASVKKIEQPTKNAWSSVAWHSQLEERSVKDKNMHQDGVFKAEIVYLGDSDGGDEDQKHLQSESKYYSPQEQTMLHSMYEPPLNYLQHIRSDCVPFTSIKTSEDKLLKLNSSSTSKLSADQLLPIIFTSQSETPKERNAYSTPNENKAIITDSVSDKLQSHTVLHDRIPEYPSLFADLHLSTIKFPTSEGLTVTATKLPARDDTDATTSAVQVSEQNSLPYYLYNNSGRASPFQRNTSSPSPLHFIGSGTLSPPLSLSPCPSGRSSTLSPLPLQIIRHSLTPSPVCLQIPCKRLCLSTGSINQLHSQLPLSFTAKQSRAKSPGLTQLSLLTAILKSGRRTPSKNIASSTKHFHEKMIASPSPPSKVISEKNAGAIFKDHAEKTNDLLSEHGKRSLYTLHGQPNDTSASSQTSIKTNVSGRHSQKTLHSLTQQLCSKPNLVHHEHHKFCSITPEPSFTWTSSPALLSYPPSSRDTLSSDEQKTSRSTTPSNSALLPSSSPHSAQASTFAALHGRENPELLDSNAHSFLDPNKNISLYKIGPVESPRHERVCSLSSTSRKHSFHSSLPDMKTRSVFPHPDSYTHSNKPGLHPLLRKSHLSAQMSHNLPHATKTEKVHPKTSLQSKHIPNGFTTRSLHRSQPLLCTTASKSGKLSPAHFLSDLVERTPMKLKEYKISSSYKTLAAVPTNKLLMEQKETDEPIQATEKSQSDQLRDMPYLETHSQLHSPSQLRQQSEELYATIDRVLQESTPRHRSASVPTSQRRVLDSNGTKMARTLPGLAGRETKYAQLNSPPSASRERKQREEAACFGEHTRESTPLKTKPGVIRPVPIIIKQKEDNYQPNPFRKYLEENLDNDIQQLLNSGAKINKDDSHRIHGQQVPHAEKLKSTPCPIGKSELLLITEEPVDKSSKSYA
ncbi:muscular LMNA-interacting protein isoform X3 [Protopterus annectens]|uniref:muscular LMNA-interacting protein isoform X3 n=1 Tax=Protopterus annectens TaxID=7888 RepID=UPI001CFC1B3E|nr:muscular LMNA-interacting protein isoform X3 [Protopterus annectens]